MPTDKTNQTDTNQEDMDDINFEPEDSGNEIISYAEILAAVLLNDEIVITIPMEDEERVKNGIKNYKSKQAAKLRAEGQPYDSSTLTFSSVPSEEFYGCVDLTILSKNRGIIKIKKMRIPENDLPD